MTTWSEIQFGSTINGWTTLVDDAGSPRALISYVGGAFLPSLDYSDYRNSQYLPLCLG